MSRYEYIAVVDTDEVIMPLQHNNWLDMIREIKIKSPEAANNISTYVFRTALFLDKWGEVEEEIPEWLHMMSHVYQERNFPLLWCQVIPEH